MQSYCTASAAYKGAISTFDQERSWTFTVLRKENLGDQKETTLPENEHLSVNSGIATYQHSEMVLVDSLF